MNEPMKVLGLKAKNLRNIEIVEVDLKGKEFVEITGDNGAAKSTLIDIIFGAMIGKKYFGGSAGAWQVIKSGANKAQMKVTIGNKSRQIEVTRSITRLDNDDGPTKAGGSLKIEDTEGEALGQEFLDSLISVFTVDVKGFARLSVKDQIKTIYDMLGVNVDDIDAKIKDKFDERTLTGRQLKVATGRAEGLECEEIEAVSVDELIAERQSIEAANVVLSDIERQRDARQSDLDGLNSDIIDTGVTIARLKKEIGLFESQVEKMNISATDFEKELKEMPKLEQPASTDAVDQAVRTASVTNDQANQYRSFLEAQKDAESLRAYYEKATKAIDKLKDKKDAALKSGKLPFRNLSIDDTLGLMIGDVPFTQKSAAEQIRISAQIGMRLKPDLRVLTIRDGSLLDSESFKVVKKLSEKEGYQVLVESVGEKPGENEIVLREGQVISKFEEIKTADEKAKDLSDTL